MEVLLDVLFFFLRDVADVLGSSIDNIGAARSNLPLQPLLILRGATNRLLPIRALPTSPVPLCRKAIVLAGFSTPGGCDPARIAK